MPVQPEISVKEWLGLDNASDESRLLVLNGRSWLKIADNTDIDDEYMLHRRKGYSSVLSGSVHSFWSNSDIALFLSSGTLKRLNADYTATSLLSGLDPDARIHYVFANGKVYFTNGVIIRYYKDGSVSSLATVTQSFKTQMKPGHLIEYFNSRLYTAEDNIIWYSDAANLEYLDLRQNFIPFRSGRITMMQAVTDGMYVSADGKTYFLAGRDPSEFVRTEVAGTAAIEGSATKIPSEEFSSGAIGSIAVWASSEGIWTGEPGGKVRNRTWAHYSPDDVKLATALVRDDNGYSQYVIAYEVEFDMSGEIDTPLITTTGWME
jgi:hypothetical protein